MSVALSHPALQLSLNRGLSKSIHSRFSLIPLENTKMSVALSHPAIQLSLNRGLSKSIHSRTYPSVVSFAGRAIRCSSLDPAPKSKLVDKFFDNSQKSFGKTIGQAIANDVYKYIKPLVNNSVTSLYNLMGKIAVCHPIIFCVVMTLGIGVLVGFIIKKTFETTFENSGGNM